MNLNNRPIERFVVNAVLVLMIGGPATLALGAHFSSVPFFSGSGAAPSSGQQNTAEGKFGSSLKRLKWDNRKNQAVEKPVHQTRTPKSSDGSGSEESIKLSTLLVTFDVLVTDKSGKPVSGLSRDDFIVRDENAEQQIESFSVGTSSTIARRIILLIDRSGSERAYIDESVEAARTLIEQLGPHDEVALVDDDVDLIARYTADKSVIERALERIQAQADAAARYSSNQLLLGPGASSVPRPGNSSSVDKSWRNPYEGRSLQFTALFAALRELMPNDGTLPVIIFQTDGDEAPTLRDQPEADEFVWNMPNRNYGLGDIFRAAERSRATIYSVIPSEPLLGIPQADVLSRGRQMLEQMERSRFATEDAYKQYMRDHPLSEAKVKLFTQRFVEGQRAATRVAELTGGWPTYLETPDQAGAVYSKILSDIQHRFVIGYYPTDSKSDGRLHRVEIQVKNHPEYVVHGRDSYFAPLE